MTSPTINNRTNSPDKIWGCPCCCPVPASMVCSAESGKLFPAYRLHILNVALTLLWFDNCEWRDAQNYFKLKRSGSNWTLQGTLPGSPTITFSGVSEGSRPLRGRTKFSGTLTTGIGSTVFSVILVPVCDVPPIVAVLYTIFCPDDGCCSDPVFDVNLGSTTLIWDWTLFNGQGGYEGTISPGVLNYDVLLDNSGKLYITTDHTATSVQTTYGPITPSVTGSVLPRDAMVFGRQAKYRVPYWADSDLGDQPAIIILGDEISPSPVIPPGMVKTTASNCPMTTGPLHLSVSEIVTTLDGNCTAVLVDPITHAPIGTSYSQSYTLNYDGGTPGYLGYWDPNTIIDPDRGILNPFPTGLTSQAWTHDIVVGGQPYKVGFGVAGCGIAGIFTTQLPGLLPPIPQNLFDGGDRFGDVECTSPPFDPFPVFFGMTTWSVSLCPIHLNAHFRTWYGTPLSATRVMIDYQLTITE